MNSEWAEANGVMPGAWRVLYVKDLEISPPNNIVAMAASIGMLPAGTLNGYGDTPDDALRALTKRLREKRDGADTDRAGGRG